MDDDLSGQPNAPDPRERNRHLPTWAGAIALILILLARPVARALPPDGVLRTRVGPAIALTLFLLFTVYVSVQGWRLWRGTLNELKLILPADMTARRSRAVPAAAVACWAVFVALVIAIGFGEGGLVEPSEAVEDALTVVFLAAAGIGLAFGGMAYSAALWRWPRFVLPASERRGGHSARVR